MSEELSHFGLTMMPPDFRCPIRGGWNESRLVMRGQLTDRKIAKYSKRGFYSKDQIQARKNLRFQRAAAKNKKREPEGNFVFGDDGRLIYSPK